MAAPAISVFTAAHEAGEVIRRPWRSLLEQPFDDWEWVVVDDSDSDETWREICDLADDPRSAGRLRIHRREGSGSIGANKAAAASACRGSVLLELDHDDRLIGDALGMVRAAFDRFTDVSFVYSDWVDERNGEPVALYGPRWAFDFGGYASERVAGSRSIVALAAPLTWETIRHIAGVPNHLRAWRKSSYEAIGGHDPGFAVADDYELIARTILDGGALHLPHPLYVQQHDNDTSASRRHNASIQAAVSRTEQWYRRDLDEACLRRGVLPHGEQPLTDDRPLVALNRRWTPLAPAVSVVMVPTGDGTTDRRLVEAVLDQTLTELELLVVGNHQAPAERLLVDIADPRARGWDLVDGSCGDRRQAIYAIKAMARSDLVARVDAERRPERDWLETLKESVCTDSKLIARASYLQEAPAARHAVAASEPDGEQPSSGQVFTTDRQRLSRWIAREPWRRGRVPADALRVPSMLSKDERAALYEFARHVGVSGACVDAGVLFGGSTAALAAGARQAGRVVHAFDRFRIDAQSLLFMAGGAALRLEANDSTQEHFRRFMEPWRSHVVVHEGDVAEAEWDAGPIAVLHLDVCKTPALNRQVLAEFLPALTPGRSILVQQDLVHEWQPHVAVSMGALGDVLRLVALVPPCTAVYVPTRGVTRQEVGHRLSGLTASEELDHFDRATVDIRGAEHDVLQCARAVLTRRLLGESAARDAIRAFRASTVRGQRSKLDVQSWFDRMSLDPEVALPAWTSWRGGHADGWARIWDSMRFEMSLAYLEAKKSRPGERPGV